MTSTRVGTAALAETPGFRLMLAVTLSAVVVSACASSGPATTSLEPRTVTRVTRGAETVEIFSHGRGVARLVAAPVDSVWLALPVVYDRLEIPVALSDRTQWTFGNPRYRAHRIEGNLLSQYLDCGRGLGAPYADQYSVTLSVLTRLTEAEGGTMVVTTIDGAAVPRELGGGITVPCFSEGTLESRLVQLIVEVLEREGPRSTQPTQPLPQARGNTRLRGLIRNLVNRPLPAVSLEFEFLDAQGATLYTGSVDIPAMQPGGREQFQIQLPQAGAVAWRYRRR